MNELENLKAVLTKNEAQLVKKQEWLNEVGLGKLTDEKLAKKRIQVRRDISELISTIKIIKEMISE